MKKSNIILSSGGLEALQARFGLRVAARLSEASCELPHDVSERLKASRELALERARLARRAEAATSTQMVGNGSSAALNLGGGRSRSDWWFKFASALPIAALVAGFFFIEHMHTRQQIAAAAEIDAALLADDVPPAAYSDPGFVEFLKVPRN
ncbi:MAG: DUF3619 family protein [Burkholderiales bacterium]|jgi:hypothetical protein|nr:DUF3619 family protein [Burkholderiales bacterium]